MIFNFSNEMLLTGIFLNLNGKIIFCDQVPKIINFICYLRVQIKLNKSGSFQLSVVDILFWKQF